MPSLKIQNLFLLLLGIGGWLLVYMFQDFDIASGKMFFEQFHRGRIAPGHEWRFVLNKSTRFFLNDFFSLFVIYGLFPDKKKLRLAIMVMLFSCLVLLPLYLTLAIQFQDSGQSLLVFLHRITMNPWLMIILIPGFYYADKQKQLG